MHFRCMLQCKSFAFSIPAIMYISTSPRRIFRKKIHKGLLSLNCEKNLDSGIILYWRKLHSLYNAGDVTITIQFFYVQFNADCYILREYVLYFIHTIFAVFRSLNYFIVICIFDFVVEFAFHYLLQIFPHRIDDNAPWGFVAW